MTAEHLQEWNERWERIGTPIRLHSLGPSRPYGVAEGVIEIPARLRVIHTGPAEYTSIDVYGVESSEPVRTLIHHWGRQQRETSDGDNSSTSRGAERTLRMLLAPRIGPREAEKLRGMGIAYADHRGNCYLNVPGILIDISGKTASTSTSGGASPRKRADRSAAALFSPRRAQIAAMLLSYPLLLESSIREIGWAANVSVGTAAGALKLFTESGYLRSVGERYYFESAPNMLAAWSQSYPSGLGRQCFAFDGEGNLERILEGDTLGWVGGELAVSDLISTKGGVFYVEGEDAAKKLIRAGRIRTNAPRGASSLATSSAATSPITINRAFWRGTTMQQLEAREASPSLRRAGRWAHWEAAPLAVVYADLVSNPDPRLNEVSEQVKEAMAVRWETHGFAVR